MVFVIPMTRVVSVPDTKYAFKKKKNLESKI